jgi:hypothetical protein
MSFQRRAPDEEANKNHTGGKEMAAVALFDTDVFKAEFTEKQRELQKRFPHFLSFYGEFSKSDYFADSLTWLKSYVKSGANGNQHLNTYALFTMQIFAPKWNATNTTHYLDGLETYLGRVSSPTRRQSLWNKIKPEATLKSNALIEAMPELVLINQLDRAGLQYVEEKKFTNASKSKDADVYFVSKGGKEIHLDVYTPQSNEKWDDDTVWAETLDSARKSWVQGIKRKVSGKYDGKFRDAHASGAIKDRSAIIAVCLSSFEHSTAFLTLWLSKALNCQIFDASDWARMPGLHSFFCYQLVPESESTIGLRVVVQEAHS